MRHIHINPISHATCLWHPVFLQILEDWRYIAMVIDRLQLYIFLAVTIGGTIGILMAAPHIFEYVDQDKIIQQNSVDWGKNKEPARRCKGKMSLCKIWGLKWPNHKLVNSVHLVNLRCGWRSLDVTIITLFAIVLVNMICDWKCQFISPDCSNIALGTDAIKPRNDI